MMKPDSLALESMALATPHTLLHKHGRCLMDIVCIKQPNHTVSQLDHSLESPVMNETLS